MTQFGMKNVSIDDFAFGVSAIGAGFVGSGVTVIGAGEMTNSRA